MLDVFSPSQPIYAEVIPPPRSWESVPRSRIRGVGRIFGERLTGTLAEEMLTPGSGQIRALIACGGNVANCVPDQPQMIRALRSLDLLVTIDPYMCTTAQLSHYVLPPFMQYERADLPLRIAGFALYEDPWAQYAPPILQAPSGSELAHDWYVFWSIAKRLGLQIVHNNVALDMATRQRQKHSWRSHTAAVECRWTK